MKTLNTILKIVAALAAVAGAVYVIATYGDQIVAWAKRFLASLPKCPCCQDADIIIEPEEEPIPEEEPVPEEAPVEEAPAEAPEVAEEEFEVVDIPVEAAPNAPVAEDTDFAE